MSYKQDVGIVVWALMQIGIPEEPTQEAGIPGDSQHLGWGGNFSQALILGPPVGCLQEERQALILGAPLGCLQDQHQELILWHPVPKGHLTRQ